MLRTLKIAACQVPDDRENIEARLTLLENFAHKASLEDIQLLLFPEGFLQGYLTDEYAARRNALNLKSPAFTAILNRLTSIKPVLVFGLIELDGEVLFNTAVVIHEGKLRGTYRKNHLLPSESIFQAGDSYPIFEIDRFKFGINICYDMQFAEAAAAAANQGADVILCPANNMMRQQNAKKWKDRHHEMRIERARETGLWILSADVTGEQAGRIGYGPTSAISPTGKVVSQVPLQKTGMIVQEIQKEA